LSGNVSDAKLQARYARNIAAGLFTSRFWNPAYRHVADEVLPAELFSDSSLAKGFEFDSDGVWEFLKEGNLGGAKDAALQALKKGFVPGLVLNLTRYGQVDIRAKQRIAYAAYRAYASTLADAAGVKGATRKEWMKNTMLRLAKDNPNLHREAMNTARLWLMDYDNVPVWINSARGGTWL
jgi:hypothetical protein